MVRRRHFLLGLTLGAGGLLAAACGGAASPTPAPKAAEATKPAAAATPAGAPTSAAGSTPAAKAAEATKPPSGAIAPPIQPITLDGFPSKTLRIMAPAAPGGGWDQTARALQTVLQEEKIAAQPVEVVNRAGAGGTVGLAELINQNKGDGHVAMVMGLVMVGAILTNKSPVNLSTVTPLARLTTEYEAIAVGKDSKYQTLQQLLDDFKRDPKAIKWGGGSAGGTDHILVGLLAKELGVDPKGINYIAFSGGGELRPQVIGNQVTAGVSGYGEFKGDVQAGQLRILAVSGPNRQRGLEAPTLKEGGANVEITNWRGIVGPPGIKENERQAWGQMLGVLNGTQAWQQTLIKQDWTSAFLGGQGFISFLKGEDERVTAVLKEIGLA